MRCSAAQRSWSAQFDDPSAEPTAAAREHLATCARCQAFAAASRRVRDALRDTAPTTRYVPATIERASGRAHSGRARPGRVAVAGIAAAVIALAAGGTWLAIDDGPEPISTGTVSFPVVPDATAPLLVWTAGGLPDGFAGRLAEIDAVERTTVVDGDHVDLDPDPDIDSGDAATADGGVVDLDVLAIDPASYADFVPEPTDRIIRTLSDDEAVLGRTSSVLRALGAGDSITIDGRRLRIVAVVDDALVGAAEVVVSRGARPRVATERFVLVAYSGARLAVEAEIRSLLDPAVAVRFRAPGETRLLRHGDAVLPQSWVKRDFGEFVVRSVPGSAALDLDDGFVAAEIETYALPLVGEVTCHRALREPLTRALEALPADTAAQLRGTEAICFDPRESEPGLGPSRHSWGIASALAVAAPVKGGRPVADAGLVEAFAAAGFTWGGNWLAPDPTRFEWVGT